MITYNNDNIAQQWFTLKSKKNVFQQSTMGTPIASHPDYSRFHIRTSQAESVFLFCQLASSHHLAGG